MTREMQALHTYLDTLPMSHFWGSITITWKDGQPAIVSETITFNQATLPKHPRRQVKETAA